MFKKKKTHQVFGMSNTVLEDSYIDRGNLDDNIRMLLGRSTHIALRGESKCGKSWLRQRTMPNALVVQCRLKYSVKDIYVDALSQLGIEIVVERSSGGSVSGQVKVAGEVGLKILSKLGFETSIGGNLSTQEKTIPLGKTVDNIKFIANILKESGVNCKCKLDTPW